MNIINEESIISILSSFNPWWKNGLIDKNIEKTYKRFAYFEAYKYLESIDIRRAVILTGARRVGKTTIMYQLIKTLLEMDVNPRRVLFLSLDHPILKLSNIGEIVDYYRKNIYENDDMYIFFDEVQYSDNWSGWIKTLYDMHPRVKMVATGSASPVIEKGATESGVGRWVTLKVPTLSFYEYLEIINIPKVDIEKKLKPTDLFKFNDYEWSELLAKMSHLQVYLSRYLEVGGFPELALAKDSYISRQVLREDIVDKVLKRDIPVLYNIRNIKELEKIFLYLCFTSSNIISIEAIAKELNGVSRKTVEDYITYLEASNLIYRSFPVDLEGKKILKARPKIYIVDASIRNAVLMKDNILMDPEEMGIIIETTLYRHINAFYYQSSTKVGYFRDSSSDKEIDIVVDHLAGKILIESKYRENVNITEKDAVLKYLDDKSIGIVVTKNEGDHGVMKYGNKKILKIPAFIFLYLLGNAEKYGYKGENIV